MNTHPFKRFWPALIRRPAARFWAFFSTETAASRLAPHFRVQACLDGELSERDTKRVTEALAADAEAQAFWRELGAVKTALAGNEPERVVPESREFYWSRIERGIAQEAAAAGAPSSGSRFPWKWRLIPAASLAVSACAVFLWVSAGESRRTHLPSEVEVMLAGVGTVTYRDHQAGLTVVWHYNRNNEALAPVVSENESNPDYE